MVITDLNAIGEGSPWPIPSEQERMDKYFKNGLLFEGKHGQVWPDLNPFGGSRPGIDSSRTFDVGDYIDRNYVEMTIGWFKVETTTFADLLCGEPFKVVANEQATADRIIKDNSLVLKTYDLSMDLIKNGTGIYKIRFDKKGIIEIINPRIWYPVVSPDNSKEIIAHVLAWSFKSGDEEFVRSEIHERGKITNKLFKVVGGKLQDIPLTTFERYSTIQPEVSTGINEFLIVPVQNILDGSGVFGTDDYSGMCDLVKELERRLIQNSRILTKHADPSVSGPASKIDIDPYSGEAVVIGGGQYYGYNSNEPAPAYMVWDAKLEASYLQIDKIIAQLYIVSELSPAALGDLKQGLAESGSALKRLMIRTLSKTNRLRLRLDPAIHEVLRITADLEVQGRTQGATALTNIQIKWEDGLPRDESEITKNECDKKMSGLTTVEMSLKKLNPDMSNSDIQDAVVVIQDESIKANGV